MHNVFVYNLFARQNVTYGTLLYSNRVVPLVVSKALQRHIHFHCREKHAGNKKLEIANTKRSQQL